MNSLRIDVAQDIICEAEKMNAGLWIEHSKVVANCSKEIAEKWTYPLIQPLLLKEIQRRGYDEI